MKCFYCDSDTLVRRGKTSAGTQRYKCMNCKRTFTEKNRKSRIPVQFIAFMLYQKDMYERNKGRQLKMWKFRAISKIFLKTMDLKKKDIPKRTLHYWINTYGEVYKKISRRKAFEFVIQHQRKSIQEKSGRYYEDFIKDTKNIKKPPWKEYLWMLQETYGNERAKLILDYSASKNKKKGLSLDHYPKSRG